MILSPAQIAAAARGQLLVDGPLGPIQTDTRRLQPGDWFLALRGERFDGHDFLDKAIAAGCAGVIVEALPEGWALGAVRVDDTLAAMQACAALTRDHFFGEVVGITGSAGKTTCRAMTAAVLQGLGRVHQTVGNLNNHIGVPMTLLARPDDAELMVVEMGMSGFHEIRLLQALGRPTVRVITNVGAAHTENIGSVAGVAACKQEMFDGARPGDLVLVNLDDDWIPKMPLPLGVKRLTFGSHEDSEVRLLDVAFSVESLTAEGLTTSVRIQLPGGAQVEATIPAPGRHIALNALIAAAVGHALGLGADAIAEGLTRYAPVGMRMRVERRGGVTVLNDAYNANPTSMRAALQTLASLPGRKVALLGDMLELGVVEAEAHAEIATLAAELGVSLLGLSGSRMSAAADAARTAGAAEVLVAEDAQALGAALDGRLLPGDVVLVKGSRGARMERAIERALERPKENSEDAEI